MQVDTAVLKLHCGQYKQVLKWEQINPNHPLITPNLQLPNFNTEILTFLFEKKKSLAPSLKKSWRVNYTERISQDRKWQEEKQKTFQKYEILKF